MSPPIKAKNINQRVTASSPTQELKPTAPSAHRVSFDDVIYADKIIMAYGTRGRRTPVRKLNK
jgi:hypothetical protein